jgi:hypothetical protein
MSNHHYNQTPLSLSDLIFEQYSTVAGLASTVELQMRLLASRTPELERHAHSQNLDFLEQSIHDYFDSKFNSEEKEFLRKTRGLRNKILHSDFKAASTKTNEITGAALPGTSVFALKLSTSEVKPVSEMSKREAGVFGWMLECFQTGVFRDAESIFKRAIEIYRRVTFEVATEE